MLLFLKRNMWAIGAVLLIFITIALVWFYAGWPDKTMRSLSADAQYMDLGFTYLPVTPKLAQMYNLGASSGALVTEVFRNSTAERAGIKAGDIILNFNGANLEADSALLGMIMTCPGGENVTLEVWRGQGSQTIELAHGK